jgi:uncharacterized protein (DUF302 family)
VRVLFVALIAMISISGEKVMSADGLVTLQSSVGPEETMGRLEAEVRARGMTIFCQIDHAAGAAATGMPLRPTNLLIFGGAKGGTPLMQSVQVSGIDLPLKALVWQDEAGNTFLSYNDPAYVARRHGLDQAVAPTIDAMSIALEAIAKKSTASRSSSL